MLICISEMEVALLQLQWQVPLRPPSVSGFQTASKRSAVTVLLCSGRIPNCMYTRTLLPGSDAV
jgi:hypothetical protein